MEIGVFEGGRSVSAYLHVEEDVPREPFLNSNECLTTLLLVVFTQRNFVADFLLDGKRPFCVFKLPGGGGLWTTYAVHFSRLFGERVVEADFLLVSDNLTSFARCYG